MWARAQKKRLRLKERDRSTPMRQAVAKGRIAQAWIVPASILPRQNGRLPVIVPENYYDVLNLEYIAILWCASLLTGFGSVLHRLMRRRQDSNPGVPPL